MATEWRVPILTYHGLHAPGWDYAENDHVALEQDLERLVGGSAQVHGVRDGAFADGIGVGDVVEAPGLLLSEVTVEACQVPVREDRVNRVDALLPDRLGFSRNYGCGIGQNQRNEPTGMTQCDALPDHAPHR